MATSQYVFDKAGHLTSLIHYHDDMDEGRLASYEWQYDTAGRLVNTKFRWTAEIGVQQQDEVAYRYDDTDQLTGADYVSQTDEGFSYDDNGNRTSVTTGTDPQAYTTDAFNRVKTDGTYTYSYDAEGNREYRWKDTHNPGVRDADEEVTEYTWDNRNRLTHLETHNPSGAKILAVDYFYDALNRRIGETVDDDGDGSNAAVTQHFVWDSLARNVVLDFVGNNASATAPARRCLWGPAVDQLFAQDDVGASTTDVKWMLADHALPSGVVQENDRQLKAKEKK